MLYYVFSIQKFGADDFILKQPCLIVTLIYRVDVVALYLRNILLLVGLASAN